MSSVDVSVELIRSIAQNIATRGADDWESFSVILGVEDDPVVPVIKVHAYVYDASGKYSPGILKPRDINVAVRAYLESYYGDGKPWPVKLLVQYSRTTGNYEVLFEADDDQRWEDEGEDLTVLPAQLRPTFTS